MLIGEGSVLGWLLGDDPSQGGTPELQWGLLPESWGVFVLIAVVLAAMFVVVWLYLIENKVCPLSSKIFLAVLRSIVVLLIIIFCLQPYIVRKRTRTLKPTIGFLRDASDSMDRFDEYGDPEQVKRIVKATGWNADDFKNGKHSRAEIFQQVFNRNDGKLIAELRDKGSIRIVDFAETLNDVATIPATGEDIDLPTEDEVTQKAGATISLDFERILNAAKSLGFIPVHRDPFPKRIANQTKPLSAFSASPNQTDPSVGRGGGDFRPTRS